jgi:nucleoside-diphosphate-sugar epimerase
MKAHRSGNMWPMRYGLTGGSGFVGCRLAKLLVQEGHSVVALVRNPPRAKPLADLGIELIAGDLLDLVSVRALTARVDGLFHVAAWYHVGGGRTAAAQAWRTNVEGTRCVLEAARNEHVRRLVYTSTLAVNSGTHGRVVDETYRFTGRHLSAYDETKAVAQTLVSSAALSGAPAIIVMPGVVYGPGDTSQSGAVIRRVLHRHRVVVPSAGRFCWGFIDDIARGHLLAMEHGRTGESYMLAGPPHSLAEVLAVASGLAGGPPPVVIPSTAVRAAAAAAGLVERVVAMPDTYSAEALRSSLATYLGTPAKAQRELGWSARPLEEGLAETLVRS